MSTISPEKIDRLSRAITAVIGAYLVAGRQGQPAEGKIPFNPLYFHMLRVLSAQGATRPSALGTALGVPKTTLSTAAKALEKRGLLGRRPDPKDGRAQLVFLTDDGIDVLDAIKRQDQRNAQAMLSAIDPQDIETFLSSFEAIAKGATASREPQKKTEAP